MKNSVSGSRCERTKTDRVAMDAIIASIGGLISDYAEKHPTLTHWITVAAGTISVGALLATAWAYWKRPIIRVRLGKKEHASITVEYKDEQGKIVGRLPVKYFRVRIRNGGLTTIKECNGQLIKVTRRVVGKVPAIFDNDECYLGWAGYSQSVTRNIPRETSFPMDVATLVLQPNGGSQLVVAHGQVMPNTLRDFLNSYSGKATYTLDVLVAADNARPRKVPVEVAFDPKQTELTFIPFNTRYPWWRLWWWLRAQWSRRWHP